MEPTAHSIISPSSELGLQVTALESLLARQECELAELRCMRDQRELRRQAFALWALEAEAAIRNGERLVGRLRQMITALP